MAAFFPLRLLCFRCRNRTAGAWWRAGHVSLVREENFFKVTHTAVDRSSFARSIDATTMWCSRMCSGTGISFSSSPSPGSPVRAVFDRQFTLEIAPECLIGLPPGWPYENEIHAWLATRTRVLYFLHAQIERDPSIFLSLYRPAFFFSFGQTNSANLPSTESQKKNRYCKIRYRNVLLNIHTN